MQLGKDDGFKEIFGSSPGFAGQLLPPSYPYLASLGSRIA